jgi:hypothetical protein
VADDDPILPALREIVTCPSLGARISVRFLPEIVPTGAHSCQFLSRLLENQLVEKQRIYLIKSDF